MENHLTKQTLINEINKISPSHYEEVYNFIKQWKVKTKPAEKKNAKKYLGNIFSLEGILYEEKTSSIIHL